MKIVLGQEAIVGKYGLGRVTEIGPTDRTRITNNPEWIGVTPYVAGYQMNFNSSNVELINVK